MMDDFGKRGVQIAAVSANDRATAEKTTTEWGLDKLPIGYELSIDDARNWGLFVSNAIKDTEPAQFVEPGTFIIRADGTLYSSIVQSMPFSRATGEQILGMLDFVIEKDYPARGEANS